MEIAKIFVIFVLLLLNSSTNDLFKGVAADQIITSSSGSTFGRNSREPRFNIEFHPSDSTFHPENGQESVVMKNKDGASYNCYLPITQETKTMKTGAFLQNSSNALLENDKKILKTPDELLDVLKDEACLYRHEGWWSYELCYQKTLRQVHVEDEKVVQEFVLGQFDPEATLAHNEKHSDASLLKDPRSKDASQRYHAHQYTNGTICDLTGFHRETEVRFLCTGSGTQVVIGSIKEISSCKYVVTVQAPMLCKHPMFQQERPTLNINCIKIRAENEDAFEENQIRTQITLVPEEPEHFAT
ncbi:Protein OS-9 [Rhynchospora pubera]|uniref:Protein OS-9 homolog n=1 Tax=Rhynchospora pubera TaxID=906938 RepID=A0AAV8HXG4_9POAL|nr:Protein OS-9 [Rhynchospora pubera]KAJ4797143.1 Protein OS-9 [Rhynchospora pubera]KAJ4820947.1 Protein OS-9 [Rhynchospora pubera]